jgi:photoactive yellow protein
MDHISFEGVNLAELLPRIPDSIKDGLPFGLVKLDLTGTILEYNMAEGELTGVDPKWAIGKNFFDDVAICTKTQAFYGRFVEGVKKGFVNAVFDYTFDHKGITTQVKVNMVTVPDHLGRKNVMILVKRADKPRIVNAFAQPAPTAIAPAAAAVSPPAAALAPATPAVTAGAAPSLDAIVAAVMAALNQGNTPPAAALPTAAFVPATAPAPAAPAPPPAGRSRHEDILKF